VLNIQPEADRIDTIPTGDVVSEWDLQFAEGVPLAGVGLLRARQLLAVW